MNLSLLRAFCLACTFLTGACFVLMLLAPDPASITFGLVALLFAIAAYCAEAKLESRERSEIIDQEKEEP